MLFRPQNLRVVTHLLIYCGKLRQHAGVDPRKVIETLPFPVTHRQLERWEDGLGAPAAGQLDRVVNTYAMLLGLQAAGIWVSAVTKAWGEPIVQGRTLPGQVAIVMDTDSGEIEMFTSDGLVETRNGPEGPKR